MNYYFGGLLQHIQWQNPIESSIHSHLEVTTHTAAVWHRQPSQVCLIILRIYDFDFFPVSRLCPSEEDWGCYDACSKFRESVHNCAFGRKRLVHASDVPLALMICPRVDGRKTR